MKSFLREFRDFVATGNMVELAVAVVLGAAVKAVIDAFIANVAAPIIGAIVGEPDLDDVLVFTLREGDGDEADSVLAIGPVLTQLLSLVLVGLVLFLVVKAYNRVRRPRPVLDAGPTEVQLLTQIRDELRAR
jgi:large conductance mechanosensitive channel